MLLKLIACNVFMREACLCIGNSPHKIDPEFLELGEHIRPELLRGVIQGRIDAASESHKNYDAILLLYGLCGNAGVGLQSRTIRLVMPRAHDCCTVLLGSRERFKENFESNPSTPFSSVGYMERGEYYLRTGEEGSQVHYGDQYAALVEQYGEENAKYVWETMHPVEPTNNRVYFIDIPETSHLGAEPKFREKAETEGKTCIRLEGNLAIIRKLCDGTWDPAEFVTVDPGHRTGGVYDWNEIIRSVQ